MFVVDTNLLLYAADRNAPEHGRCRSLLLEWRESPAWHMTWGIFYEFLRVATHPRVFRQPMAVAGAWSFLESLLASPGLSMLTETDRHPQIMAQVIREVPLLSGNLVFDAHTVVLMKEHGVRRIYTRDADFHRFPGIAVSDPLAA